MDDEGQSLPQAGERPQEDHRLGRPPAAQVALEKRTKAHEIRRTLHSDDPLAYMHEEIATDLEREAAEVLVPATPPTIAHGEVVPTSGSPGIINTLENPDEIAIDASLAREQLLTDKPPPFGVDRLSLGLDIAKSIGAQNSLEKSLAYMFSDEYVLHQNAVRNAVESDKRVAKNGTPADHAVSARWHSQAARSASSIKDIVTALVMSRKLQQGEPKQTYIIKHVHVDSGGKAMFGPVQVNPRRPKRGATARRGGRRAK